MVVVGNFSSSQGLSHFFIAGKLSITFLWFFPCFYVWDVTTKVVRWGNLQLTKPSQSRFWPRTIGLTPSYLTEFINWELTNCQVSSSWNSVSTDHVKKLQRFKLSIQIWHEVIWITYASTHNKWICVR